jgi:transcriptional regulator GlxA family with amidase domain
MKTKVGILLFSDVEVLDFAGPFEVFSVTNELNDYSLYQIFTIGFPNGPIIARNGLSINNDYDYMDTPEPDILVIPGGLGTRPLLNNSDLMNWLNRTSTKSNLLLSVCTGSLLLAKAGLLKGRRAITHHRALSLLKELEPDLTILEGHRYVDDGFIISAGGISAGIDMSLYVVSKLLGEGIAQNTANYMEYNWNKE